MYTGLPLATWRAVAGGLQVWFLVEEQFVNDPAVLSVVGEYADVDMTRRYGRPTMDNLKKRCEVQGAPGGVGRQRRVRGAGYRDV